MTILNYSPRLDINSLADVRFTIGTDEFASAGVGRELVSLTIQRPRLDPGIPSSPYGWTGNFTLQHTLEARKNGRSADFYDEFVNPSRWRKAQQRVTVWYKGYKIATLRITDQYAFTQYENGGTAQGGLFDLVGLLNRNIPPIETEGVEIGAGTPIETCVNQLLLEAGKKRYANKTIVQLFGVQFAFPIISGGWDNGDKLDTNLVTSNPLQSAQELLGKYFRWLYVDKDEVIRDVGYLDASGYSTISRSEKRCEILKDYNAIHFAASLVTVSGSRRVIVPVVDVRTTPVPDPVSPSTTSTDDNGKPQKIITERYVARGFLDNVNFPGDTLLCGPCYKTIFYTYDEKGNLTKTVTETQKLIAELVPKNSMTLEQSAYACGYVVLAQRETESLIEKSNEITRFELEGLTNPLAFFPNSYLIKTESESVQNFKLGEGTKSGVLVPKTSAIDPKTGQSLQLEAQPQPEPPQKAPEFNFETQTLKGFVTLPPLDWSLFFDDAVYYNAGFLPSQITATNLAGAIALKETYARDSYNVTFPDFDEWLGSGARPFMRCAVDNLYLIATNDIFLFSEDGTTSLTIYGNRQGGILKIPNPREPIPIYPTTGFRIAPLPSLVLMVGDAIVPIQATALAGAMPYTFSSVDLPSGLSISSSGLITGTPTLAQANTASTVTVTDNLSNVVNGSIYIEVIQHVVTPITSELIDIAVSVGATCSIFVGDIDVIIQINDGVTVETVVTSVLPPVAYNLTADIVVNIEILEAFVYDN
jgi:hypothetical protein